LTADPAAASQLASAGFKVVDNSQLALTGNQVLRLRAPAGLSRNRALARAREAAPGAIVALNDLYRPATSCDGGCAPLQLVGWEAAAHGCSVSTRIGMIDTGIDLSHPLLSDALISRRSFLAKGQSASGTAHGTAVASILIGSRSSAFQGLLSGSALIAADAFYKVADGDRADAFGLVLALDWIVGERAAVINMSLSGPDNDVLERIVTEVTARGVVIVAAAGNDRSPASGYPGRYSGVIAVAGVDNRLRPLSRAMRGDHIAFSAPASGVAVAKPNAGTGSESGTSFAAPFVTAAYALALHKGHARVDIESKIATAARDLGAPGRDRVYGYGLVQLAGFGSCR
jgi:subtilisin family serine protease